MGKQFIKPMECQKVKRFLNNSSVDMLISKHVCDQFNLKIQFNLVDLACKCYEVNKKTCICRQTLGVFYGIFAQEMLLAA